MRQEVRKDLKELHDKLEQVHIQAKLTNGRVNLIEPQVKVHNKILNKHNVKLAVITVILVGAEVGLNLYL